MNAAVVHAYDVPPRYESFADSVQAPGESGRATRCRIRQALAEFFTTAAAEPFQVSIKTVPLRDLESLWNAPERGTRRVFQP